MCLAQNLNLCSLPRVPFLKLMSYKELRTITNFRYLWYTGPEFSVLVKNQDLDGNFNAVMYHMQLDCGDLRWYGELYSLYNICNIEEGHN